MSFKKKKKKKKKKIYKYYKAELIHMEVFGLEKRDL